MSPQTFAVDIWSLGMVTLLLFTAGTDVDLGTLNRSTPETLTKSLDVLFAAKKLNPSCSGKDFVRECLSISPPGRISAKQAARHAWLCSPPSDLKLFKRFDRRMRKDWSLQMQLKPMPMELPSPDTPRLMVTEVPDPPEPRHGSDLVKTTQEISAYFLNTDGFAANKRLSAANLSSTDLPATPARPIVEVSVSPRKAVSIIQKKSDLPWMGAQSRSTKADQSRVRKAYRRRNIGAI